MLGANGSVSTILRLGTTLYVAGFFTGVGAVAANRVAKWDGMTWSALGTGANNTVNALAVDGSGKLYAGGFFTAAGGAANTMRVAKWRNPTSGPVGTSVAITGTGLAGATDVSFNGTAATTFAG